jgi:mRNA-degrading endonuclease RelE of RelBE toxin-antitoxin system
MDYKVRLKSKAKDFILSQRRPIQRLLIKQLDKLALNPTPKNSELLDPALSIYKLKHKDYRILYRIKNDRLEVLVAAIGGKIYTKDLFKEIIDSLIEKRSSSSTRKWRAYYPLRSHFSAVKHVVAGWKPTAQPTALMAA